MKLMCGDIMLCLQVSSKTRPWQWQLAGGFTVAAPAGWVAAAAVDGQPQPASPGQRMGAPWPAAARAGLQPAACSKLCTAFTAAQGAATPHMLAVMGQSADRLFSTVNQQLLRVFAAAEASAAAGGGQPPSRGAKYALNVMLQGMNVPSIAAGLTQVR